MGQRERTYDMDVSNDRPQSQNRASTRHILQPSILTQFDLFSGLSGEAIGKISELCESVTYPEDAVLFAAGDESTGLYLLVQGELRVSLVTPKREQPTNVAYIKAPAVVGEMALVDGQSRSATVSAHTAARGFVIPQAPLWELIDNDPRTGCILMRNLAGQLAQKLLGMNAMLGNIVSQQRTSTLTS